MYEPPSQQFLGRQPTDSSSASFDSTISPPIVEQIYSGFAQFSTDDDDEVSEMEDTLQNAKMNSQTGIFDDSFDANSKKAGLTIRAYNNTHLFGNKTPNSYNSYRNQYIAYHITIAIIFVIFVFIAETLSFTVEVVEDENVFALFLLHQLFPTVCYIILDFSLVVTAITVWINIGRFYSHEFRTIQTLSKFSKKVERQRNMNQIKKLARISLYIIPFLLASFAAISQRCCYLLNMIVSAYRYGVQNYVQGFNLTEDSIGLLYMLVALYGIKEIVVAFRPFADALVFIATTKWFRSDLLQWIKRLILFIKSQREHDKHLLTGTNIDTTQVETVISWKKFPNSIQ